MNLSPTGVPPAELVSLYSKQALSEQEFGCAIDWATKPPPRDRWALFLRDWFLIFGALLIVAGVVMFGAYNWQSLHRFAKLGLVQLVLVGSWAVSRLRGHDSDVGRVLLLASALLTGALLAVFGQAYQTGADVYTLFLSWAALILPWCLMARFNALWFLQALLLNLSFTLYLGRFDHGDLAGFALATGALNLVLAGLWEAARRSRDWMSKEIADALFAGASLPLTLTGCWFFWDGGLYIAPLLAALVLCGALRRFYGGQIRTMTIVAFSLLSICGSLTTRILSELSTLGFLLNGLAILAQLTLAAQWLKKVNAAAPPRQTVDSEGIRPAPTTLQILAGEGLLEPTPSLDQRRVEPDTPLYVSLLIGLGAWLSSWFFLAFVILLISDSGAGLMSTGFVLWIATLIASRAWSRRSEFGTHTCLAVNIAGQLMTVLGVGIGENWTFSMMTGTALLLQAVSLIFYKDGLGRALFAFASVTSGAMYFWETGGEVSLSVWLLLVAFLISWLLLGQRGWLLSRWRYWHGAVAFGWCCGLLAAVSFWAWAGNLPYTEPPHPEILSLGLTMLVTGCALRLQAPWSAVAALLTLGGLTFGTPGLMAAMLVFILAFHTRSVGAWWLSILGLATFGVLYYYSLELSLMVKSITLVGSGLLFLVARSSLRGREGKHAF